MSGISSSVGLISGLNTQDLIDQLIQIQSQPLQLLKQRVSNLQTQRTAYMDLSARLMAVKNVVSRFATEAFFQTYKTQSSDESVMTATAGAGALPGTYQFRVHSLVSNHQLIGQGFADADTTPVGAGTLTVEIGHGQLNPATEIDSLRGGQGIRRGTFTITDGAGGSARIDLRAAVLVDDIIDAINNQTDANVRASVSGDGIVIEDLSGGAGPLQIADQTGGSSARDLGLLGSSTTGRIDGSDLVNLVDSTLLSTLNDGNGVRRNSLSTSGDFRITTGGGTSFTVSLSDFLQPTTRLEQLNSGNGVRMDDGSGNPPGIIRITDRSGKSAEVDLSGAKTIQDVLDQINAADVGVRAIYVSSHLQISDTTETPADAATNFKIEDVSGFAARDLGIAADVEDDYIGGSDIFRIASVGDVVRAINYATDNDDGSGWPLVTAALDNNGLRLEDNNIGGGGITVEALADSEGVMSQAALDLGLEGEFTGQVVRSRDLIAGLDTVLLNSLNGGRGVTLGSIAVTDRLGNRSTYDLSGAQTVQNVLDIINSTAGGANVIARINPAGNGIEIVDETGSDIGSIVVEENGSTTAADLGLLGSSTEGSLIGRNTQLRYLSEATRLEEMNHGQGVRTGRFKITNSRGAAVTINVSQNQKTLGDIIRLINSYSDVIQVTAGVNANGDGLLLTDAAGGTQTLQVTDQEGGTATDLRIAGEAAGGQTFIDGTMEITVDIDADDTLNDVVTKLNNADPNLAASVVNDGSQTNAYRLTVSSQVSGRRGYLGFDVGNSGLAMETLVQAHDAVFFLGDGQSDNPVVVSSPTNSVSNVIPGVTLNLLGASDDPVSLNVSQDVDKIATDLGSFVTKFNDVLSRIDDYTEFDAETETRGVLLGDVTARRIQDRLNRSVLKAYSSGTAGLSRLADVGIQYRSGRLEFDEEKFRETYRDNPRLVEQLFTDEENGIGAALDEMLDELTKSSEGLIDRAATTLQNREDDLNDRMEAMQALLDGQRTRLERQFQGLETALANLSAQQTALASLATSTS
ncbi:MAG: flagellar filament capping protein FliD [Phycisphaerae bacterium]|nr:flagellar filament capping protein FliD [Phycisphaerae bacterium]